MSELNYDELFNFTAENALQTTESKKTYSLSEGMFKPSIRDEKCKDETYRALVRFMPFFHDNKVQTTIERWECYLKDVNENNAVFVVSPKTVGKKCPIREMGWKLYKSESAIDKANSKKINVYQQWYAIVEIIKDIQHPEFNGKFMIYQFGKKIHDKIEDAMRGSEFSDKMNPFDFFAGNCFEINLTKGNQKMDNGSSVTNYEACKFVASTSPLHYMVGDEVKTVERTRESMDAYLNWLNTDAPKINNFQWKDWDQELTDKVNANLATFTSTYSAPRTTTATVNETVNNIINNQPKVETENVKPAVSEEETEVLSNEEEDWVKGILNQNN